MAVPAAESVKVSPSPSVRATGWRARIQCWICTGVSRFLPLFATLSPPYRTSGDDRQRLCLRQLVHFERRRNINFLATSLATDFSYKPGYKSSPRCPETEWYVMEEISMLTTGYLFCSGDVLICVDVAVGIAGGELHGFCMFSGLGACRLCADSYQMCSAARAPINTPSPPVPNMAYSSHFLRVSRAMAARAMQTCSTVVAWAQRWC